MAVAANRRSIMALFSGDDCVDSHRVRHVLREKDVTVDIVRVDPGKQSEDLLELNPYGNIPTLVDRDLVLHDARVIMEYLDERFPHPPLMPVDPVSRARSRLAMHRIESDWFSLVSDLDSGDKKRAPAARKALTESLVASNDVFAAMPFFLSEEFSLVDCCITPLLWRLTEWEIEIPSEATAVQGYADRMFARDAFKASLTESEREMRL